MPDEGQPLKYKFVLAPPTDVDPPTNPLWTKDGIIGVHPPFFIKKDLRTPYDDGAKGNGYNDDTAALQRWLDNIAGGIGLLPTGTYMTSAALSVTGSTTIYGAGRTSSVIAKSPQHPASVPLVQNKNWAFAGSNIIDQNITIYNVGFQGSSTQATTTNLMGFIGVYGLTLEGCLIRNHRYYGIFHYNCHQVTYQRCEFYDLGNLTPMTAVGGCAIQFQEDCTNWNILNCYIHNGAGGIGNFGNNIRIIGNHIQDVLELCVFGNAFFCLIEANTMVGVKRQHISASAIEIGGSNNIINGNTINGCGNHCIAVIGGGQYMAITNNVLRAPGLEQYSYVTEDGATPFADSAHIAIDSARFPEQPPHPPPRDIVIANNVCGISPMSIPHAILFSRQGLGEKLSNIYCHGNSMVDIAFTGSVLTTGAAIGFYPNMSDVVGQNFMVRNNHGADIDLSTHTITFIVPQSTVGTFPVSGIGFRPSHINFFAALPNSNLIQAASVGVDSRRSNYNITTQTGVPVGFDRISMGWATDGTKAFSGSFGGLSINVRDMNGFPVCCLGIVEINNDGFLINVYESLSGVVTNGGTGYNVGDTGLIAGGDGQAEYLVTEASGGVVIKVATGNGSGNGYVTATGATTTAVTGSGSGLVLSIYSGSPTVTEVVVSAVCHA